MVSIPVEYLEKKYHQQLRTAIRACHASRLSCSSSSASAPLPAPASQPPQPSQLPQPSTSNRTSIEVSHCSWLYCNDQGVPDAAQQERGTGNSGSISYSTNASLSPDSNAAASAPSAGGPAPPIFAATSARSLESANPATLLPSPARGEQRQPAALVSCAGSGAAAQGRGWPESQGVCLYKASVDARQLEQALLVAGAAGASMSLMVAPDGLLCLAGGVRDS